MKNRAHNHRSSQHSGLRCHEGFSLVELMVGLSLTGMVMAGALTLFVQSARQFQDGSEHVTFIEKARVAEQRIANEIQNARAISVTPGNTNSLEIIQPDLTRSRMFFREGDTVSTSHMIYDPDVTVDDDEVELSSYVSEIPQSPMFQVLTGTTNTTLVTFYVGLRPPEGSSKAAVRKSYTGASVFMTATPRNIVDFIQE